MGIKVAMQLGRDRPRRHQLSKEGDDHGGLPLSVALEFEPSPCADDAVYERDAQLTARCPELEKIMSVWPSRKVGTLMMFSRLCPLLTRYQVRQTMHEASCPRANHPDKTCRSLNLLLHQNIREAGARTRIRKVLTLILMGHRERGGGAPDQHELGHTHAVCTMTTNQREAAPNL